MSIVERIKEFCIRPGGGLYSRKAEIISLLSHLLARFLASLNFNFVISRMGRRYLPFRIFAIN